MTALCQVPILHFMDFYSCQRYYANCRSFTHCGHAGVCEPARIPLKRQKAGADQQEKRTRCYLLIHPDAAVTYFRVTIGSG